MMVLSSLTKRIVQIALAKATLVDDIQNKNQELMKQIRIYQVRGNNKHILCKN
jgi:hypothetical protein